MRILFTGATGYLGRNLLSAILARGHECICLKRPSSDISVLGKMAEQVMFIDIGPSLLKNNSELPHIDIVFHLAANYGRTGESLAEVASANLLLSIKLLEAVSLAGAKTFIYTSTTIDRFTNAYSLSKLQAVEWGRFIEQRGLLRFVEIALEHFYGPGDSQTKFTSYIFDAATNNKSELELSPGNQCRDFIYIDDVVRALVTIAEHEHQSIGQGTRWDVGSGQGILLKDFVMLVCQIAGAQTKLNFGALPYRNNETMYSVADIAPLKRLGWEPLTSLNHGVLECVNFLLNKI